MSIKISGGTDSQESVISLFSSLSLQESNGRYAVEKIPGMNQELFDLKAKVYSMCLERFFMQKINAVIYLHTAYKMQEELEKKGFTFLYDGQNCSIVTPHISDDTPIAIIKILSRIARSARIALLSHSQFSKRNFSGVAAEALSQCKSSGYELIVDQSLSYHKYVLLLNEYYKHQTEVQELFSDLRECIRHNISLPPDIVRILDTSKITTEVLHIVASQSLGSDRTQWPVNNKRAVLAQLPVLKIVIEALQNYSATMPFRQKEFESAVAEMKALGKKIFGSGSLVRLCTPNERKSWDEIVVDPTTFGQLALDMDASSLMGWTPEKDDGKKSQASFLPEATVKQEKAAARRREQAAVHKEQARAQKKQHAKKQSPLVIPYEQQAAPSASASSTPSTQQTKPESQAARSAPSPSPSKHAEKTRTIKPCSLPQKTTPIFSQIKVGTGPDTSIEYIWHVRMWDKSSGFDPITEHPSFTCQRFSPDEAAEMRFRHAFGRALDPFILRATPFVKLSPDGKPLRKNYCRIGDIIFSERRKLRGIFRLTKGVDDKVIHKFFTVMPSDVLIARYAEEGTFAMDIDEKEPHTLGRESNPFDRLPDDESRVTHLTSEYVEVRCATGEILVADLSSELH